MTNSYVFADDDSEYLQLNDFYTAIAYRYWELYGLSADKDTSYTETLNTISQGTASGSFTFTGQFSGSFNATVELAISGLTTTDLDDVDDILSSRTFYYFGEGSETQPLIEMSISSGDNEGTEYIPRYGCTYNPSATGASATMTCTPNTYDGAFTMPDQDVKVTSIDVAMNSVTDYQLTLTLKNENTVRGSLSGSLSLSGGGQGTLTMTENGSATTTTVNINTLEYTFPLMVGTVNNTGSNGGVNPLYPKNFYNDPDDPFTVIFFTKRVINRGNGLVATLSNPDSTRNYNRFNDNKFPSWKQHNTGYVFYAYRLATNDVAKNTIIKANWNFYNNFEGLIPIYVGRWSTMPDNVYRFVVGSDRIIEVLEHGNTQSQSAANGMNQVEQDFVGKTDELIDFEGDTFNSMDSAIDGVQLNNNLISGSGFLNAANWVRVQFDNLISYSPLSSVLVFSLSLGFALLIIGKVR